MSDTPTVTPTPFSADWFTQEINAQTQQVGQAQSRLTMTREYQAVLEAQAVLEYLLKQQALLAKPGEPPTS